MTALVSVLIVSDAACADAARTIESLHAQSWTRWHAQLLDEPRHLASPTDGRVDDRIGLAGDASRCLLLHAGETLAVDTLQCLMNALDADAPVGACVWAAMRRSSGTERLPPPSLPGRPDDFRRYDAGTDVPRGMAAAEQIGWIAGVEAGQGRHGRLTAAALWHDDPHGGGPLPQPDLLQPLALVRLVEAIVDGLAFGTGQAVAGLIDGWDSFWPSLQPSLAALEVAWHRPGLARLLTVRLERRLLPAVLSRSLQLGHTVAVPVDVAALRAIEPRSGVDTLLLEFEDRNGRLQRVERPLWGTVSAADLAALLEGLIGWDLLLERGRFDEHAGFRRIHRRMVRRSLFELATARLSPEPSRRALAKRHLRDTRHVAALCWLRRADVPDGLTSRARAAAIVGRAAPVNPTGDAPPVGAGGAVDPDPVSGEAPVDHLPVLAYGDIVTATDRRDDDPDRHGAIDAGALQAQLDWLRRQCWRSVTATELLQPAFGQPLRPPPGRCFCISFDGELDGFVSTAWPLVRSHGFVAQFFLTVGALPRTTAGWDRLRSLRAEGIGFGIRFAEPMAPIGLSSDALLRVAADANARLRSELGVSAVAAVLGPLDGEREWHALQTAGFSPCFAGEGRSAVWDRSRPLSRVQVRGDCDIDAFSRSIGPAGPPALVSVIVPAYCASATIDATLASVRAQSHRALEILVIDDGSTDDTVSRVERHAAVDPRIRLIRQANAGVAAARNRGLREARGEWVAPVDSDDLWHPHKIERQLGLFEHGSASLGLVYSWYEAIDEAGDVIGGSEPEYAGRVLDDLMRLGNFVGNGSSVLMRRSLALRFGYDASLRDRQAQGCEDFKLYFDMATVCEFAVVPDYLTGYRVIESSMSGAVLTMYRSYDLVVDDMSPRFPRQHDLFRQGRVRTLEWLSDRAARRGQRSVTRALVEALADLAPARAALLRRQLRQLRLQQWLVAWVPGAAALSAARRRAVPRKRFAVGRPD